MRILFVSSSSGSRGGGEIHVLYLAEALAREGHEVILWASTHERMDELAGKFAAFGEVVRDDYTNTYDRPLRSVVPSMRDAGAIAARWQALAPDVVHVNKQNLEDGLDLLRAAEMSGLPSVAVIHITQTARYLRARLGGIRDFQARRALQRYPGPLVAIQDARGRDLETFLDRREGIHTINNGVPLTDADEMARLRAEERAAQGLGDEHLAVVAVGRMVPQKRPQLFLDVARAVHAERPDVRFRWVGDGPLSEMWDERVAREGLEGVVERLPWQATVQPYLAAADVFLHPAEFEGLPLALIEAMSARLPCILPSDLAADMETLPPDTMQTFERPESVAALLGDRDALAATARRGRAFIEDELSLETMAHRYLDLYRSTIQHATVRSH